MKILLPLGAASMLLGCGPADDMPPETMNAMRSVVLSALTVEGTSTQNAVPQIRLRAQGIVPICASSCAQTSATCAVSLSVSGRLEFSIKSTVITQQASNCLTECNNPPVECLSDPLPAGRYHIVGLSESGGETLQTYHFEVGADGPVLAERPFDTAQ